MPNLYGDILSDVAAQIAGSVGLAGSANIGEMCAMFEAMHGSAPRRAGKNLANPSGLLLAAVLMLVHIGQPEVAERVHNAWLRTIEDGIHTYDIYSEGVSTQKVGTKEFAGAVIARLGQKPIPPAAGELQPDTRQRTLVAWPHRSAAPGCRTGGRRRLCRVAQPESERVGRIPGAGQRRRPGLQMLSNRGVKVWPGGMTETFCTDSFRCRFLAAEGARATPAQVISLLERLGEAHVEVTKTEYLRTFDGQPGFSLAQGE